MNSSKIRCVILVGGPSKGTRFRPLSFDIPKPLFPSWIFFFLIDLLRILIVAGFEMIYHQIHALSKIPDISEVFLIGFYDKSKFNFFLDTIQRLYGIQCKYAFI